MNMEVQAVHTKGRNMYQLLFNPKIQFTNLQLG